MLRRTGTAKNKKSMKHLNPHIQKANPFHSTKEVFPIKSNSYTAWQIYDTIFKRVLTLSSPAVIRFINGLFSRDFPLDSPVSYPNKELIRPDLKRRSLDILVTIAEQETFHLEAQMTKSQMIVLRVFEYGFLHAMASRDDPYTLRFPEAAVIYLNRKNDIRKEKPLHISFGSQGSFDYQVKNFVYLKHTVNELDQMGMSILIPFQALRLRRLLEHQYPSPTAKRPVNASPAFSSEEFSRLQDEIRHDIIESIDNNFRAGNLTEDDAGQLLDLTSLLYEHIQNHFYDKQEGDVIDLKPFFPGTIELPNDKYRLQIAELKEEISKYADENARFADENAKFADEIIRYAAENAKFADENARFADENAQLKARIAELESKQNFH